MGASPEKFFEAIDRTVGVVSKAAADQENNSLKQELLQALTTIQSERELLDGAAHDLKVDLSRSEGK